MYCMGEMKEFVIHFGGLSEGEHEFEFHIGSSFFREFENSPVHDADVDVLLIVDKKDSMMLLDFTMSGEITVSCDRCLEDLALEFESFNELIVKSGDVKTEEEVADDVLILPAKEKELDVSRFIYEFITLMIPMRNVHEDENGNPSCDPEVLKSLEEHGLHPDGKQGSDPRWDILKNINLN